jgi:hypothetical protein
MMLYCSRIESSRREDKGPSLNGVREVKRPLFDSIEAFFL